MAVRHKSTEIDLSRQCPLPTCVSGIVWNGEGPTGTCPVCNGQGRVSLSEWMRFTFGDAHRASNE